MPFKTDSDPELITKSGAISQALTPEVYSYLISLLPTSEGFQAAHNSYSTSYAAYLAGDPEKAKDCEVHRNVVNEGLSILVGVAKAVAPKDPKVMEMLALNSLLTKGTSGSVSLAKPPAGFKVVFTPEGDIVASVTSVKSARGYQVWACEDDPSVEGNWRLVASSSACRRIPITGLNRAKNNWLKIRAMRGKSESSPWSNIVSLPPA